MRNLCMTSIVTSIFFCVSMFGVADAAADELPQTSPEGMVLLPDTEVSAVYAMPGASLDQYTKIILLDCYVAFRKDWERDYNRSAAFSQRVSTNDMERIKQSLADEFRKVFTGELEDNRGYAIATEPDDDVLILRPALVNLDVTSPDTNSASMTRTFVTSAGQVTLYLELYDSVTGAIIARIIDPQAADRGGFAMRANRMTNRAEADRILRRWANLLGDHLGTVKQATEREQDVDGE